MAGIRCPAGFSEEIICCFLNEEYLKLKPKMTNNQKFTNCRSFYAIFVKVSTDFAYWNVEKNQQGTSLLSSSLL